MANEFLYTMGSISVISLVTFVGVFTLSLRELTLKRWLIYIVSFAAGALIGNAFIHLLPEVVENTGFGLNVSLYVLAGIAFSFIVEKIVHWHHHHTREEEEIHPYVYLNLIGDGIHNFIDGIIIAISYLASIPLGIATTIAVIFHEIPQEIGDFGVLLHGGFTVRKALWMNFATALTAFLGAILTFALYSFSTGISNFLLPFAAGNFIYIASSDLIPELHKEINTKKSILQLIAFGIGIMIMVLFV